MENTYNYALSALNTLVETCRFSEKGYLTAAENIGLSQLKNELTGFAHQRATFRGELEKYAGLFTSAKAKVSATAEKAIPETVQRGWINLNYVLTGSNKAILSACEKGESAALKTYETVMSSPEIPNDVKSLLRKQLEEIEAAQTAVSTLKGMVL